MQSVATASTYRFLCFKWDLMALRILKIAHIKLLGSIFFSSVLYPLSPKLPSERHILFLCLRLILNIVSTLSCAWVFKLNDIIRIVKLHSRDVWCQRDNLLWQNVPFAQREICFYSLTLIDSAKAKDILRRIKVTIFKMNLHMKNS